MDPIKSFMVPSEKFVTVERDTDVQTAARLMRPRTGAHSPYPLR